MSSSPLSPYGAHAAGAGGHANAESIHARLRRATADQHGALDQGLRYLLSHELSLLGYTRLLEALFGFYVPLEARLRQLHTHARVAVPLLRRAPLLEHDLHALGTPPARVPLCAEMPRLATLDHVAGAIYVIEGACLGGQVIARAAMRRLRVGPENGAAFFVGAGAQTAARWKRVLAWLDQWERGTSAGVEIIEGACRTFEALAQWLSARGVLHE